MHSALPGDPGGSPAHRPPAAESLGPGPSALAGLTPSGPAGSPPGREAAPPERFGGGEDRDPVGLLTRRSPPLSEPVGRGTRWPQGAPPDQGRLRPSPGLLADPC